MKTVAPFPRISKVVRYGFETGPIWRNWSDMAKLVDMASKLVRYGLETGTSVDGGTAVIFAVFRMFRSISRYRLYKIDYPLLYLNSNSVLLIKVRGGDETEPIAAAPHAAISMSGILVHCPIDYIFTIVERRA